MKFDVYEYAENAAYTTAEAALILRRSDRMVRHLCKTGRLKCVQDSHGFLISGRSLRDYIEGII